MPELYVHNVVDIVVDTVPCPLTGNVKVRHFAFIDTNGNELAVSAFSATPSGLALTFVNPETFSRKVVRLAGKAKALLVG